MARTEPGSLNDKCLYTLSHQQISFTLKLLLQKLTLKIKQIKLFKIQFEGFYFLFCVWVFVQLYLFPVIPESTIGLTTVWPESTWGFRFFCTAGGNGHLILQIKPKIIYTKKKKKFYKEPMERGNGGGGTFVLKIRKSLLAYGFIGERNKGKKRQKK